LETRVATSCELVSN